MGKPFISSHAFVPVELLRGPRAYEAHKELLTVRPKTYMDAKVVEIPCYNDTVDGYLGLPIEWALHPNRYGNLEFEDRTSVGTKQIGHTKDIDFNHESAPKGQEAFVNKIISVLENNYSCFSVAETGTGKSVVALAVAAHFNLRTLIICDQTNLINQFYKEALLHLGLPKSKVAIIRGKGGVNMHAPICIGSIKSLVECNYPKKFFDSFGTVIFDECHSTTSAVTYSQVFNRIRPTYRIGLTATEKRKDGADKILKYHLGPKRAELEGQSMPCTVYVHDHDEDYEYWGESPSSHVSQLAKNKKRNKKILRLIVERFKAKRHIIVMSERIDQLENFEKALINLGVPQKYVGLYTGSKTVNGKRKTLKDEKVVGLLDTARILLTTYKKGAKGLNVKRLDCLIEATPMSDGKQPPGRVRRFKKGKKRPEVHTFRDLNNRGFVGRFNSRLRDYKKLGFEVVYVSNS